MYDGVYPGGGGGVRYITRFKDAIATDTTGALAKSDTRLISAALAVKCADLSHTARPAEKYAYWARLMIEEFRQQVGVCVSVRVHVCHMLSGPLRHAGLLHAPPACITTEPQIVQERLLEITSSFVMVPKTKQQVAEAQIGLLSCVARGCCCGVRVGDHERAQLRRAASVHCLLRVLP